MSDTPTTTDDMAVETVATDSLRLDPENVRAHDERNVRAVAASFSRFGQRRPLVVWRDMVIAGNASLTAVRSLGWEQVAVHRVPEGWSEAEAKAFAIADNRTAELARWEGAMLVAQLEDLGDLAGTGFDAADLADLRHLYRAPDLDELAAEHGGFRDDDGFVTVRFRVPTDVAEKAEAARIATGLEGTEADVLVIQAAWDALCEDQNP